MSKLNELEAAFKRDCTLINMNREYPNHTEKVDWVIITALSETDLQVAYGELLEKYVPYILAPIGIKDAVIEFRRNEDKHRKRMLRSTSIYDIDEESGRFHPELSVPSFVEEQAEADLRNDRIIAVNKALSRLTKSQRRRLLLRYMHNMTLQEIGKLEGCSQQSVRESIESARKKFKKVFSNTLQNGTPLSKHNEGVNHFGDTNTSSTLKN